jgi:NAD(P)H-nitrite reductase large subunit
VTILKCLSFSHSEVGRAIGKDNLQKCSDVMANVKDEALVKVCYSHVEVFLYRSCNNCM